MAITIQTERELRKYLFETFLKQQQEKGLLKEAPGGGSPYPTTYNSGEPSELAKSAQAIAKSAQNIFGGIKDIISDKGRAESFKVTFDDYPETMTPKYIALYRSIKQQKIKELSGNLSQFVIPNTQNLTEDIQRINILLKLEGENNEYFKLDKNNENSRIAAFNMSNMLKIYATQQQSYLYIPFYVFKNDANQWIDFGKINLKDYRLPKSDFVFKDAILEEDIINNKEVSYNHVALSLSLDFMKNNPIWNTKISPPEWNEEDSRKKYGNVIPEKINSSYKKNEPVSPWGNKYPEGKGSPSGIPALNVIQGIEKSFFEIIKSEIYAAREFLNGPGSGNKSAGLDIKYQIYTDQFQKKYFSVASIILTEQLNLLLSNRLIAGPVAGDPTPMGTKEAKAFSTKGIKSAVDERIQEQLKDYKTDISAAFENQKILQYMQLKRINSDNLNYSRAYTLKSNADLAVVTKNSLPDNLSEKEYEELVKKDETDGTNLHLQYMSTGWSPKRQVQTDGDPKTVGYENENRDATAFLDKIWASNTSVNFLNSTMSYYDKEYIQGKAELRGQKGDEIGQEVIKNLNTQSVIDAINMSSGLLSWGPQFEVMVTIGALTAFASFWNRGGFIDFIEDKIAEIDDALNEDNRTIYDNIINDFVSKNIEIGVTADSSYADKKSFIKSLKTIFDTAETMEQILYLCDAVGWIPVVSTLVKAKIMNKLLISEKITASSDFTTHTISVKKYKKLDNDDFLSEEEYQKLSSDERVSYNANPIETYETVNIDPDKVSEVSNFLPTISLDPRKWFNQSGTLTKKHLVGAMNDAIEKIYIDLFIPLRTAVVKTEINSCTDTVTITISKNEIISDELYQQIIKKDPNLASSFTDVPNANNVKKYITDEENTFVLYSKGDNIESKILKKLQGEKNFKIQGLESVSESKEISFEEFIEKIEIWRKKQVGGENDIDVYGNILSLMGELQKDGINLQAIKKMYAEAFGIPLDQVESTAILAELKEINKLLKKWVDDGSNIKVSPFQNSTQHALLEKFGFLSVNDVPSNIKKIDALTAVDIDRQLSVKFLEASFELSKVKFPKIADYAFSYEVIKDIPNTKFRKGMKISSQDLAKAKVKAKKADPNFNEADFIKKNPPLISGGEKKYKEDLKAFMEVYEKTRISQLDFAVITLKGAETGNNLLTALKGGIIDKTETAKATAEAGNQKVYQLGNTFKYLKNLEKTMRTGNIVVDENLIASVGTAIKDWLSMYEQFFNYLLYAKYSGNNELKVSNIYKNYAESGAIAIRIDKIKTLVSDNNLAAALAEMNKMHEDLLKGAKGVVNVDEIEKISARAINLDDGTYSTINLANWKRVMQSYNQNIPMILKGFHKGLNDIRESLDAFSEAVNTVTGRLTDTPQMAALKEVSAQMSAINTKITNTISSLETTSFFSRNAFKFSKDAIFKGAYHITSYSSQTFILIRELIDNLKTLSFMKLGALRRIFVILGIKTGQAILDDIFELYNTLFKKWDKSDIEKYKINWLEDFPYIDETFSKILKKITTIPYDEKSSGFVKAAAKLVNGIKFIAIGLAKHPILSLTTIKMVENFNVWLDQKNFEELTSHFSFANAFLWPVLYGVTARVATATILSGSSNIKKQFTNLINTNINASIATYMKQLIIFRRRVVQSSKKASSDAAKEKFIKEISAINSRPLTEPKGVPADMNNLFSRLQKQSMILNVNDKVSQFLTEPKYAQFLKKTSDSNIKIIEDRDNDKSYLEKDNIPESGILLKDYTDGSGAVIMEKLRKYYDQKLIDKFFKFINVDNKYYDNTEEETTDRQTDYPAQNIKLLLTKPDDMKNAIDSLYAKYVWDDEMNKRLKDHNIQGDLSEFKKAVIDKLLKNQNDYDNFSANLFNDEIWTQSESDIDKLIPKKTSILNQYYDFTEKLLNEFYYNAADGAQQSTITKCWKAIKENLEKKGSPLLNDNINLTLSFLDFHDRFEKNQNFISIPKKSLNGMIAVLNKTKNNKTLSEQIIEKEDGKLALALNPDGGSFVLNNSIRANRKYFEDISNDLPFFTWRNVKEKTYLDKIDWGVLSQINDIADDFNKVLELFNVFIRKLQINDEFNVLDFSQKIEKLIVFLKGLILVKNCVSIQSLIVAMKETLDINEVPASQKQKYNEDGSVDLRSHRFDLKAMLTNGASFINYNTAPDENQKIKDAGSYITINRVFESMDPEKNYLSIISGDDRDPISSLLSTNIYNLVESDSATTQIIKLIPTIDLYIENLDNLRQKFGSLESSILQKIDSTFLEPIGIGGINKEKNQNIDNNFVDFPEETLKTDGVIYKNKNKLHEAPNPTNSLNRNIFKNKEENQVIKSERQEQLNKVKIDLKNKIIQRIKSKELSIPTSKNQMKIEMFNIINSFKKNYNYSIAEFFKSDNSLKEMFDDISYTLNIFKKYHVTNDEIGGLIIFLNNVQKSQVEFAKSFQKISNFFKNEYSLEYLHKNDRAELVNMIKGLNLHETGIAQFSIKKEVKEKISKSIKAYYKEKTKGFEIDKIKDVLLTNKKNSISYTDIKYKFVRMLTIVLKCLMPVIEKINELSGRNQSVDLQQLMLKYINAIEELYANSKTDIKKEQEEYIEFLNNYFKNQKRINSFSYIIGFEVKDIKVEKVVLQKITKLLVLSDISNVKSQSKNIDFTNEFFFDIPFLYEIDISSEEFQDVQILTNNLIMSKNKIKLTDNEKFVNKTKNTIEFDIYKFKKEDTDLIKKLVEKGILLKSYINNEVIE
jgi:hypothetical protein